MIIGTGIDIVELARIRSILQRQEDAFLTRILTQGERARIPGASARRIEYIAGRYAAKEALSKALGTGIGGSFSFQDAEIIVENSGKPAIAMNDAQLESITGQRGCTLHVSISHSEQYAIAHVIVEKREDLSAYRQ